MRRSSSQLIVATAFAAFASALSAQGTAPDGPTCVAPDSIDFVGSTRRSYSVLREDAGLPVGQPVNATALQRAEKNILATGNFEDVETDCIIAAGKSTVRFKLVERPILTFVDVAGVSRLSPGTIRDRVDLIIGRPVDPAQVVRAVSKIDSTYAANGYYLARVKVDTTLTGNEAKLVFRVDEGRRFAVSGIFVDGNERVSDKTIVKAMDTKPEGFFWWRKGEFDDDKYAGDLAERIPQLYASRGYIDVQVSQDTMEVDRERGKALIRLKVIEGPQYHIGEFEVNGGKRFSAEEIARFYPFGRSARGLLAMAKGVVLRSKEDLTVFDESVWDEATRQVNNAYASEGYLYARVDPVIERRLDADSVPTVDLRWDIVEGSPAIVNRIDIKGNDVTSESCIRDQLFIIPGDVFSQDKLLRSYQNIAALNFFETPLPAPDYKPTPNDPQLLDLTFNVKEKHTGQVNFGASVGQGTGVGGFVGFDQPNVGFTSKFPFITTGKCKRASVQWQFGQFINDFNLGLTDPRVLGSRVSSQLSLYHSMSRYIIQDLGRTIRTGGSLRFGFPVPNSRFTRFFVDYGGERVKYGATGLVSTINCPNCFRSTIGTSLEHDTQIGSPFPFAGVRQSLSAQFNGGPLGGTATFQRALASVRSTATIAQLGGGNLGQDPMRVTLSLNVKGGALFGDPGPFFVSQSFALGGTQYGEQLRGYDEFSVTPLGYNPNTGTERAQQASFGNAFYTSSAELGLRLNSQIYLDAFYDVGNIWNKPTEFDPTRLFRGAGFGGAIVTPLGPLGVDLGYGFDRTDLLGRKAPAWQVHFKFGQLFQ
jgi:outer membrane protein insertion porin family